MKFTATLLAVKDMELSRNFYQEVFGLEVESDFMRISYSPAGSACKHSTHGKISSTKRMMTLLLRTMSVKSISKQMILMALLRD